MPTNLIRPLTCAATFGESGKTYTYLTRTHYPPGTIVLAEVGASDVKHVKIQFNHAEPVPLNPNITYRWILGTPEEVRAQLANLRNEAPKEETPDLAVPAGM